MRAQLSAVAAVLVAIASAHAHADDTGSGAPLLPSVRFGTPTSQVGCVISRAWIDHVEVSSHVSATQTQLALELRVTVGAEGGDVRVPLGLPRGARVTRLVVTNGGAGEVVADGMAFEHANVVLLIAPGTTGTADVELAIEAPPTHTLAIETAQPFTLAQRRGDARTAWPRTDARVLDLGPASADVLADHASIALTAPITPATGVVVTESIDARTVERTVQFRAPQLRRCYSQALQRDPTLAGIAELRFVVQRDGSTADIVIAGDLPDDAVRACLADEVATLAFPAAAAEVAVHYPIRFVPPPARASTR